MGDSFCLQFKMKSFILKWLKEPPIHLLMNFHCGSYCPVND